MDTSIASNIEWGEMPERLSASSNYRQVVHREASVVGRLKIIVVGLGHQSVDDHIPAIKDSNLLELVGVADIDNVKAGKVGQAECIPWAEDVDTLLNKLPERPDAALIAVPHSGYLNIIQKLAECKIHIIKEKPFAVTLADAAAITRAVQENDITLQVTLQRRFNPIYRSFQQLIQRIGRVHTIEAKYTMNVERLDEGWRASRLYSGGGALIDLGYHYVDLLVWYFGLPQSIVCQLSTGNRDGQVYDVEDTALLNFTYVTETAQQPSRQVLGSLIVSRVYPDKEELLVAYGTQGSVSVSRGKVARRNVQGESLECLERTGSWPSALIDQLEEFAARILAGEHRGAIERRYLEQVAFVEAAYRSAKQGTAQNPHELLRELLEHI